MKKFKELVFLNYLKGVGKTTIYKKYWDILNESTDLTDLINNKKLNDKFSKEELNMAQNHAEELYESIENNPEITAITVFDDLYPKKLDVMDTKKPLILFVKGNVDLLVKPNISFIGTRNPINKSLLFENNLIKAILSNSDRVIVSGLALGCDKMAHLTTVKENKPTMAILPSGINQIVPASHKQLAKDIIETGGCLVSEYAPDVKVYRSFYVERDKIIAAFSDILFVVQCGKKSGTMHTVDAAFEYENKNIYTFNPENFNDGDFSGNEYLLKSKKATKVSDIDVFIEQIAILDYDKNKKDFQSTLF